MTIESDSWCSSMINVAVEGNTAALWVLLVTTWVIHGFGFLVHLHQGGNEERGMKDERKNLSFEVEVRLRPANTFESSKFETCIDLPSTTSTTSKDEIGSNVSGLFSNHYSRMIQRTILFFRTCYLSQS
mmetsp:Transcript_7831/g.18868  ORF Transcript_7831/g.18868 Transcript_7831/m.18868 type:complete len:129 (+) Transcript_7831:2415-2801(+)